VFIAIRFRWFPGGWPAALTAMSCSFAHHLESPANCLLGQEVKPVEESDVISWHGLHIGRRRHAWIFRREPVYQWCDFLRHPQASP